MKRILPPLSSAELFGTSIICTASDITYAEAGPMRSGGVVSITAAGETYEVTYSARDSTHLIARRLCEALNRGAKRKKRAR